MARTFPFQTITRTVITGGNSQVDIQGRYLVCTEATQAFKLAVDDNPVTDFDAGFSLFLMEDEEAFKLIRINNPTGAPITVTLRVGFGDFRDNRLTVSGNIDVSKASVLRSIADVSLGALGTTLILAADATRREAIIRNLIGNTTTLRIGDAGAGAAEGVELAPGDTIVLATNAAIHGHNPGAGAQSVAVVELVD